MASLEELKAEVINKNLSSTTTEEVDKAFSLIAKAILNPNTDVISVSKDNHFLCGVLTVLYFLKEKLGLDSIEFEPENNKIQVIYRTQENSSELEM